jgi:uncharacterized protein YvpB
LAGRHSPSTVILGQTESAPATGVASTEPASQPLPESASRPVPGPVVPEPAASVAIPVTAPATTTASAPEESANGPGNNLRSTPNDVHALLLDDSAALFSQGSTEQVTIETNPPGIAIPQPRAATAPADPPLQAVYTSRVIETAFPFNDLVPSWNVEMPEGTGFRVEIRLGRKADGFWTPFYHFGVWGNAPKPEQRIIEDGSGVIDVDTFRSTETFDRIQYRFVLTTAAAGQSPVIRRVGLAYSNTLNNEALAAVHRKPIDPGPPSGWARRLPVPWRSQKAEDPRIRGSICSPTSVSMVLQYYGVNVPTAQVAANVFDREYRMYGNWIRAVQTAYLYGVTGYLERFGDFEGVKRHIAAGHPVIASIRVDTAGELRGAPYKTSNGHLIVIAGFDADGNLHVIDPAAATIEAGVVTYAKEDMRKAWLEHGGVGYVLTGKGK